jgi:hypothetical protein
MMIDPDHNRLSIRRQCELVSISWASFYRQPAGECPENLELMRIIDEAFMVMPWYGSACRRQELLSTRPVTASAGSHARKAETLLRGIFAHQVFVNTNRFI